MHSPGHFVGRVITATGVTPDIVLANFFIVYFSTGAKNSLAVLAYSNNLTVGNSRGAKPFLRKCFPLSALKEDMLLKE